MIFGDPEIFAVEIVPERLAYTEYLIPGSFYFWASSFRLGFRGSLREVHYSLGLVLKDVGLSMGFAKSLGSNGRGVSYNLNRFSLGDFWKWRILVKQVAGEYELTVFEVESGLSEVSHIQKEHLDGVLISSYSYLSDLVIKSNEADGIHYMRRRYPLPKDL